MTSMVHEHKAKYTDEKKSGKPAVHAHEATVRQRKTHKEAIQKYG